MNRASHRALAAPSRLPAALHIQRSPAVALLLGLAIVAGTGGPADAYYECGKPSGTPPSVTCTSAGNPYASGIQYSVVDLTILVENGVVIDTTTLPAVERGGIISGAYAPYGNLTIGAGTGIGGVSIRTDADGASGIRALTSNGTVRITSYAAIAALGFGVKGIDAMTWGVGGDITVASYGAITTRGDSGLGISLTTINNDADVTLTSLGRITTSGTNADGIRIATARLDSDVSATVRGPIITTGPDADAISILASHGDITLHATGPFTTNGVNADGITAETREGTLAIRSSGPVTTTGDAGHAISGSATGALDLTSFGSLSTAGTNADGIHVIGGPISLHSAGDITVRSGTGIHASGSGDVTVTSVGDISVTNAVNGIFARSDSEYITVNATGDVTAGGDFANGIMGQGASETTYVNVAGDVSTTGRSARGIYVYGGEDAVITIDGSVLGGSEFHLGRPETAAAGIATYIGRDTLIDIASGGSLGALSDRAVVHYSRADGNIINNAGTLDGFVQLNPLDDVVNNEGTWNLRHFADTTGDGVRELEDIAIAHFGPTDSDMGYDLLENSGTLRLATVLDATFSDALGQLTHPAGGDANIEQIGVEQGVLSGVDLMVNSGTIDLLDGFAGDLLLITDQTASEDFPALIGPGHGEYRSAGGVLMLDVRLDNGSSQQSDMLIVDRATTAAFSPTFILVADDGGGGAQTVGDGIEIVHVQESSTPDAFQLIGPLIAGAYEYNLYFKDLAKTNQNWYLRSAPYAGAAAYPAISNSAITTWQADIADIHGRLGAIRQQLAAPATRDSPLDAAMRSEAALPAPATGGWVRMSGTSAQIAQAGSADFTHETQRTKVGFDFGFDGLLSTDDRLVVGIFGAQGWSQAEFDAVASEAAFEVSATGLYAGYSDGPFYLDGLVKLDWLDGEYQSEAVTADGEVELPVFGVSLTGGYGIDLTPRGLDLRPEVELTYARVAGDRFEDDAGVTVDLAPTDSLRGRLGARLTQALPEDGPAAGSVHVEMAVTQEFLGRSEARVGSVALEQRLPRTRLELGGGFDIALPQEGIRLSFDADYALGGDDAQLRGGLRITW